VKRITEKIKIAFVIDQLNLGGTERQLKLLVDGLNRDRFEPILFLLRGNSSHPMKPESVQSHILGINSIGSLSGAWKLLVFSRILRKGSFNIVHTFFQDSAFCGALAGRLAGVDRIMISIRDMLYWTNMRSILPLRAAIQFGHEVVVNSNAVREKVKSLSGGKPVHIIRNGIETGNSEGANHQTKKWLSAAFGFNADFPVITMVSNCNRPVKRVDLLLKSVPFVIQEEDAVFIIVGDGRLRPGLEQLAGELGVARNIFFAGHRNDVSLILAGSDVFVNTSDSEGFSNSILEAMRAGLPIVASNVEGNRELVENEVNGLLFSRDDPESLAAKILLLIRNKTMRSNMGSIGKRDILNKYNHLSMIRKYEKLYEIEEIVGAKR